MCEMGKHGHFHSQTFPVCRGPKNNLDGIEPKVLGEAMSVGSADPISDPFFSLCCAFWGKPLNLSEPHFPYL